MKILFDINHPAHVHFFRQPIEILQKQGHEILVTSRDKDVTVALLDELQIPHKTLSSMGKKGILSLAIELVQRNASLFLVTRQFKPDVMASIGGVFIAHVGAITGIPSLVFYDTENAKLQNAITYPFATCIIVPRCYQGDLPVSKELRYDGYHELSYLHPNRFQPDKEIALQNGLDGDRDNFFIRLVSWQANHDVGEAGWSTVLLQKVVDRLSSLGKIHISSEMELPAQFDEYLYRGNVSAVHHVMSFCRLFIGESATMASECVVLGVPALYVANTGRGYTDEQEETYQMVANISDLTWENISSPLDDFLRLDKVEVARRTQRLLTDTIDVAAFVAETIVDYSSALSKYQLSQKGG